MQPEPPDAPNRTRRPYTMKDYRKVYNAYTNGWMKGPELAEHMQRSYESFRKFICRNPELSKRHKSKSLF